MERALGTRRSGSLAVVALLAGAPAPAGAAQRCPEVVNPYEGTRYEGVDLTRIRAEGLRCAKARRVARGAHRKALAAVPNADGVVRVRWHGWKVRGDLRPSSDRYVAKDGGRRVRWRF